MRAVFFLLSLFAAAATGAANKEELIELRSRIEALTRELAESEESKTHAADALEESERAISNANRELATLNAQLQESNKELSRLKAQGHKLEGEIADEKSHLSALLRQMHRSQEEEALKLLLDGTDINALSRELAYYSHLARARSEFLQLLKIDLEALERVTIAAEEKGAEIEALKSQQTKERMVLQEQRHERADVLRRLSKQIRQQQSEISTLKQNETRLATLIARLAKVVKPSKKLPVLENERLPEPRDEGIEFERLKGKLSLPVRGELSNRFGATREDSNLTWKGLVILAQSGASVKAIAPGKVVFADWLRGFGNLLIVDHGEGYMSLYGYNETLHRQVGDVIRAGDTIAEVGNSGGNPDPGLYFEMRHQGKPFDPLTWVRLK